MASQIVFSPYYQYSFVLNNSSLLPGQHPLILDYNVSQNSSFGPDYTCSNCQCYGFPCANCKQFIIDGEPLVKISDNKEFLIDFSDDSIDNDESSVSDLASDFSSMSLQSQIDFIASGNISWADVTEEHADSD